MFVLCPRLADGNERSSLSQSVNLRDGPTKLTFKSFDRRSSWRGARREHAYSATHFATKLFFGVRQSYQHGRRGAKHRDSFFVDQIKYRERIDLRQTNMCGARGGDCPNKG